MLDGHHTSEELVKAVYAKDLATAERILTANPFNIKSLDLSLKNRYRSITHIAAMNSDEDMLKLLIRF